MHTAAFDARVAALPLTLLMAATFCQGQCSNLAWTNEFAAPGTGLTNNTGWLLQTFDADGPGPGHAELYIAGALLGAGNVTTKGIVRWDGHQFADVGGGLSRPQGGTVSVHGLGTHDPDGPGPQLPVLVAAGFFTMAGSVPVNAIAAWNGVQWSALGSDLPFIPTSVTGICDWDPDGPGPALPLLVVAYAGLVATWDGVQWLQMPNLPAPSLTLGVFDEDGAGSQTESLFAGLKYGDGLVKWDGEAWVPVGGGLRSAFHLCGALRVIDEDGPGPLPAALFAGGGFSQAGSVFTRGVARWDGQNWSEAGAGIEDQITDIAVVDYTGGAGAPTFFAVGDLQGRVYTWKSGEPAWALIGTHTSIFNSSSVPHLAAFDEDAPGKPSLYLTGASLIQINGQPTHGLAHYACLCYPNCDASAGTPVLTSNDFVCFINRFAFGDSYANCDGSTGTPTLTGNDFTCFLNMFATGCQR